MIYVINKNILEFELKKHEHNSTKNFYRLESRYFTNIVEDAKRNINNILKEEVFIDYLTNHENKNLVENLFYNYTLSKEEILQLRFIDLDGNEQIRIQKYFLDEKPKISKIDQLQNKKDRNYIIDGLKLEENDFLVSDFNLNQEFGKIQIPHQPTIRIIKNVFDKSGERKGLLVLNINLESFYKNFENFGHLKIYLIDKDGNFLFHPENSKRWSKDLETNYNFKNEFKEYNFDEISSSEEYHDNILYSYSLENIFKNNQKLNLIFIIEESYLNKITNNSNKTLVVTVFPLVLFIGLILAIYPSKIRAKLEDTLEKIKENTKITNKYIPISVCDQNGKICYVNDAFCNLTGYEKDELIGYSHNKLRSENTEKSIYEELWKTILKGDIWEGELENKKKNGQTYWISIKITPKKNINNVYEYVSILHNISDKKLTEKLARTDNLTNLANRNRINEELEKAIYDVNRYGEDISIMILDIDYFKKVNDKFGHNIGDNLLVEFSNILKSSTRKSDIVGRWGGEEFIIISYKTNIESMKILATKIKENIQQFEFKHVGHKTCSIGFTQIKKTDINFKQIIERADTYLYIAKNNGRNRAIGDNLQLVSNTNYSI